MGWRSVAYHFRVTVTLTMTSDLVFRIIVSGAYLLYYLRKESQMGVCGYILVWRGVAYHFRVALTFTLTYDLVF